MKKLAVMSIICLGIIVISSLSYLKQADLPTVTTAEIKNIHARSSTAGGNVTNDGGKEVYIRGVCWGTVDNPTTKNSVSTSLKGLGSFDRLITGLVPDTYHHVRAFAITNTSLIYGNEIQIKTHSLPVVTTAPATEFTGTSAKIYGNYHIPEDDGSFAWNIGICYGTTPMIAIEGLSESRISFLNDGLFFCTLKELSPSTLYYVRTYSWAQEWGDDDPVFTEYVNEVTFTTTP
jgi:hypothetical protein